MTHDDELMPPLDAIICGDNVATMATFPDACIDLVVTSPPYDNLRTYGGHSWGFEGVAQQLWRIIKPGGVVVWIVADATIDGSETCTSFRQVLRFKEIGFRLHDTMIWDKPDCNPGDGKCRYHQGFEYMFVLSVGRPSAMNIIRDVPATLPGRIVTKNYDRRRDERNVAKERKPFVRPEVGFRRNIWRVVKKGSVSDKCAVDGHPAVLPDCIARDHVLSWSNEGDVVLDPFAGSFTTCKMARLTGRRWIGIEINEAYCEIGRKRLEEKSLPFMAPQEAMA